MSTDFPGFPSDTIPFLHALRLHNDREWFAEHKGRYESAVREPALDFIEVMGPRLAEISEHFTAVAKKSGGSLMRVYRDIRFSKDKTPYKTNIGIQFRHALGKDVHAPGYYLHIDPEEIFVGAGIWHPESKVLSKIREFIVDNPHAWKKACAHAPFKKSFELVGDSLKRPPRGYPVDHPLIEDLKRKDFIAIVNLPLSAITQPGFIDQVTNHFKTARPLMDYLCAAVDVPF